MQINKNVVIGVLAAVATYNEVACHINGRRLKKLSERYDANREYTNLLVERLNAEGIRPTQFEEIVMNESLSKNK